MYERRAKQERASVCKRVRVPIKSITKLRVYDPDVVLTEAEVLRLLTPRCEHHVDTPNDLIDGCAKCNAVNAVPRGIIGR